MRNAPTRQSRAERWKMSGVNQTCCPVAAGAIWDLTDLFLMVSVASRVYLAGISVIG